MGIVTYIKSWFTGSRADGQLDDVRQVGRRHAEAMAHAYVDGFESRLEEIFTSRQQRFLGNEPAAVDADFEVKKAAPKRKRVKK